MNRLIKTSPAALGVLLTIFTGSMALGAGVVELNLASTFPGNTPILGHAMVRLAEKVNRASNGSIVIRIHEPGTLVPAAEAINAVASGKVAAAWAGAGWFADKDSAFNMFSSVPFGPGIGEYMAWMYRGGGLELSREMFHAHDVHNIPCMIIPPEASGWFRKEIKTLDDLKGLRMRFFGLGAKVMRKVGVETSQLPPAEILQAMKSGALDAAEFSLPAIDQPLRLHTVAKYYYFPGWHQQATFFDLYINKAKWYALLDQHKAIIELACGDTLRETIAEGEAAQWQAMKEMQAEGVQLKRWPPEILVSLENAWKEVVAEESAKSQNFRRVHASFREFRENYAIWRHFSYLQ